MDEMHILAYSAHQKRRKGRLEEIYLYDSVFNQAGNFANLLGNRTAVALRYRIIANQ
jgi:hypothetical protein